MAKLNHTGLIWVVRPLSLFAFLHTEEDAARQQISTACTGLNDQETAPYLKGHQLFFCVCVLVCLFVIHHRANWNS